MNVLLNRSFREEESRLLDVIIEAGAGKAASQPLPPPLFSTFFQSSKLAVDGLTRVGAKLHHHRTL